jgi:hypothetical protein
MAIGLTSGAFAQAAKDPCKVFTKCNQNLISKTSGATLRFSKDGSFKWTGTNGQSTEGTWEAIDASTVKQKWINFDNMRPMEATSTW